MKPANIFKLLLKLCHRTGLHREKNIFSLPPYFFVLLSFVLRLSLFFPLFFSCETYSSLSSACNVLYLNSVETESLTGPQAVAKATGVMMSLSPRPLATVVHFKVSTQGITLTDSQRRYTTFCTITFHLTHLLLKSPLTSFYITLPHAHTFYIQSVYSFISSTVWLFVSEWCHFPGCSSGGTTPLTVWLLAA